MKITTCVFSDSIYIPSDNKPVLLGTFRNVTIPKGSTSTNLSGFLYFGVNPEDQKIENDTTRARVFAKYEHEDEEIDIFDDVINYAQDSNILFLIDFRNLKSGNLFTLRPGMYNFFIKIADENLFITDLKILE